MYVMGTPTQLRVVRFLITETGTYNPMFRRAYHTQMDAGTLSSIENKVANSSRITPQMLGGLADRFILPSASVEQTTLPNNTVVSQQIVIPHGWNERRLRFMMEVETSFAAGGRITELIQGYTDHLGVTHNGIIDPNMEFHINSILKIRKQTENTPFGAKSIFNIVDASHVLVDNSSPQLYNPTVTEKMRPEDIFAAMDRKTFNEIGSFIDQRTVLNGIPVLSPRSNGIPTNYLSTIMEGYQNALIDPFNAAGVEKDILGAARGYTGTESIQSDAFIKAISNVKHVPVTSSFTFKNMFDLDPNIQHVTKYTKTVAPTITTQSNFVGLGNIKPWEMQHDATMGMSQSWENPDGATHSAVILGNSVPGLLMDLGLTGIYFTSTNRDLGDFSVPAGMMNTKIGNWESFSEFDMSNNLKIFKTRLEREILNGLTYGNQLDYWIEMHVDLLGETWIRISISGGPIITYNQPSFADALAVPVLTQNRQAVAEMVNDMDMFLHTVIKHNEYSKEPQMSGMGSSGMPFI